MRSVLMSLCCAAAMLTPVIAAAEMVEEPPVGFSTAPVTLALTVPNGWRLAPPEDLDLGQVVDIVSPDGTARIGVWNLYPEPRDAEGQARFICEKLKTGDESAVVIGPVVSLERGRASCDASHPDGQRARAQVLQLGPNGSTQLFVLTSLTAGAPSRNARTVGRIAESIRVPARQ